VSPNLLLFQILYLSTEFCTGFPSRYACYVHLLQHVRISLTYVRVSLQAQNIEIMLSTSTLYCVSSRPAIFKVGLCDDADPCVLCAWWVPRSDGAISRKTCPLPYFLEPTWTSVCLYFVLNYMRPTNTKASWC